MNQPPIISVIIPTYNAEPFLRKSLDSCLAQTYPHLEVICVNDGSKDNSLEIIKEYVAKDKRFKLIDQPNGGYGKAMNAGFDAATGKYMTILEPDDYLPPNAYKPMIEKAEQHNLDIVKGCVERFAIVKKERKIVETTSFKKMHLLKVLKPSVDLGVFGENMNTWTCLYRMDFMKAHNIRHNESPGAAYQDAGLHKLTLSYAERMMCIPDIVYCYKTDNPGSSSAAANINRQPYAHRKEYDFIEARLKETPEVWEKVRDVVLLGKIRGFFWICHSLNAKMKYEFVDSFRKEMLTFPDSVFNHLNEREKLWVNEILLSTDIFLQTSSLLARLRLAGAFNLAPTESPARAKKKKTVRVFGVPVVKVIE